eukprot:jgi/Mesvir1/3627/Mv04364-RA.1
MCADPYGLLRGANHIYWTDVSGDWRLGRYGGTKACRAWLIGDMHAYNFGVLEDAATGGLVYAPNDFDEAVVGDYQYDLWRLAISVVLIAEANNKEEPSAALPRGAIKAAVRALGDGYLQGVAEYGQPSHAKFAVARMTGLLSEFVSVVERKSSHDKMLGKWTHLQVDPTGSTGPPGRRLGGADGKLVSVTDPAVREAVEAAFPGYQATLVDPMLRVLKLPDGVEGKADGSHFFQILDVAERKKAGCGSLGLPRYYVLIQGEGPGKERILDFKAQPRPTPYYFMDAEGRAQYEQAFKNEGERHMAGYRALLPDADPLLGWAVLRGHEHVFSVATQWGFILGSAHAHSQAFLPGGASSAALFRSELLQRAGDSSTHPLRNGFLSTLWHVAEHYAHQVAADWEVLRRHTTDS